MASAGTLADRIQKEIKEVPVLLYAKSTCKFCERTKKLLKIANVTPHVVELDKRDDGPEIQKILANLTGRNTVPNIFIWGESIGGSEEILSLYSTGILKQKLLQHSVPAFQSGDKFDYDLIVIGGGSGGLGCAKEAGKLGASVLLLDYVTPSPSSLKTQWGLGGTCVNVGCIPKKLMHRAAILGHEFNDSKLFGWKTPDSIGHEWGTMVHNIQNYIKGLNFQSTKDAIRTFVEYSNAQGHMVDPHTVQCISRGKDGAVTGDKTVTGKYIVIATGGRPTYPSIPGAVEYGITSDDLFSLPYAPGKTVVIGASYVALECAGFLKATGFDVTVLVRSILLRGFDQQMAELIGDYMTNMNGINLIRKAVPIKIEQISAGNPGILRVTYETMDPTDPDKKVQQVIECNTVLFAIGRSPCTKDISLDKAGVVTDSTGKIPTIYEQTNVTHIYALGDILKDKLELTPVAIHAGRLLAHRLFNNATLQCDYTNVATTVFTSREYGAIGLAEEDARAVYGDDKIEVFHGQFVPLEDAIPKTQEFEVKGYPFEYPWCYAKLVCNKADNNRILGFHVLSPNAGEITQGYAVGIKMGATKADMDATIGIHPTCSEIFTTLAITKESNIDITPGGC
ncbi:Thioredoxin reductase [Oopsacas minuta]|uniref:thioredoxin-disulfide reductase (NADPH) n=1 Tax=Oopsacas minuta TaxID=111878 RepID=A0AAV7KES0_9METZ|nr:Thioredoxin reductase [Oopsacas minuta]